MKTKMIPPCLADPGAWDLDPSDRRHAPIGQLIAACREQCPVLALCQQLDKGNCYGVVAGQYRPWPADSRLAALVNSGRMADVIAGVRADAELMKPGAPLPAVVELARLYGCSDTTVRSALRWLADEDVLTRPATRAQHFRVIDRTEKAA